MGEEMRLKWSILHWQTQDLFDALNIQRQSHLEMK